MSESKLFNFLKEKCEMEWNNKELICWVNFEDLREFTDIIGANYLCEGGIDVNLQETQIALVLNDLLEYAEIDPEDLLKKPE